MAVDPTYRAQVHAVLLAARDLQDAVDENESEEVGPLAANVLTAALGRESDNVVAGFREEVATGPPDPRTEQTLEDELAFALAELEVGEVLLASAAVTDPRPPKQIDPGATLSEAIDRLEAAQQPLVAAGEPVEHGLFGRKLAPDEFFTQLPATVDGVVQRTSHVGLTTVKGFAKIPATELKPLFGVGLGAMDQLGEWLGDQANALVKAGIRAVKRSLQALARLVPEGVRQKIGFDSPIADDEESRARLDESLRRGAGSLRELDERHKRLMSVIERIVDGLSRLIGPLVAFFPAATPWIYGSAGGGLVAALGITVWVGRDYLDTGVPFDRVEGVRLIVASATDHVRE
jgi:hypothetical protein